MRALARGVARAMLVFVLVGTASAATRPIAPPKPPVPAVDATDAKRQAADIGRIFDSMNEGDQKALLDLFQATKDPIIHALAAAALERTRFNLDAASKDAKVCEDNLVDRRPSIALLCARMRIGNLRLAGHARAADELTRETIERYRRRGGEKYVEPLQKSLDDGAGAPFSVDPPTGDVTLKLTRDSVTPTFDAKANGHDFKLRLDTGANDLVLSQSYADRFEVKMTAQTSRTSGWIARDVAVQHGVLDTLQLGALTLRNVPVRIVPTRDIALFGANLAATLGTLVVKRETLSVLAGSSAAPACDEPMQLGSDADGRALTIVPTMLINDAPQSVFVDTGAGWFLVGSKAALDEVTKLRTGWTGIRDIGGSHVAARAEAAKVKLTIGNQPFLVYLIVYTESQMKHAIALGGDALREMDFVLDFRHQHLCFPMHAKRP